MRVPELELELEFEFNATAELELELVNSSVALSVQKSPRHKRRSTVALNVVQF